MRQEEGTVGSGVGRGASGSGSWLWKVTDRHTWKVTGTRGHFSADGGNRDWVQGCVRESLTAGGVLPSFEDRGGGPRDRAPEGAVRTAGSPRASAPRRTRLWRNS